jgi:cytoskeletal protein CcmA (bactofilin family)
MPYVHVEKGSTARLGSVDGELRVGGNAKITAADGKLVTVSGSARFESSADIDCDFQCESLTVDRGVLKVTGELTVLKGMDVAHTVKVDGAIRAQEIEVGGKMYADSVLCGGSVRVGGVVEVGKTLEASSVDVGGRVRVHGAVKIKDLGVGGQAEVGGGSITGRTTVGGVFESRAPLEFGELQVYGKCELPAGCKGQGITTSGRLTVRGDLACERIEVGGAADMGGDCTAGRMTINGKLDVSGSLTVKGLLENFGSGEVSGDYTGADLRLGGRLRARKIFLSNSAEVAGEVETEQGMRSKSIVVGSGSRCKGPIVGERIELSKSQFTMANWGAHWAGQAFSMRLIGRMTNVEDVYGDEVMLGANTRCGKVFARTIELQTGCIVDRAVYTGELRQGNNRVYFVHPPEKVDTLPPFPL